MTTETRITVRRASAGDTGALARLALHGTALADGAETWRSRISAQVADASVLVLLALYRGAVGGYLSAGIGRPPAGYPAPGPVGRIDALVLADDAPWAGVGSALLHSARRRLLKAGAQRLVVSVAPGHAQQQAFLWGSGFTLAAETYHAPLA
ncbi:GNAT family N-acetyltransferase [Nocardiopsis coralliicola]